MNNIYNLITSYTKGGVEPLPSQATEKPSTLVQSKMLDPFVFTSLESKKSGTYPNFLQFVPKTSFLAPEDTPPPKMLNLFQELNELKSFSKERVLKADAFLDPSHCSNLDDFSVACEGEDKFIFSSKQSGDEKEFAVAREGKLNGFSVAREGEDKFVVACEDKFTFLTEASPEVNRMFSERSVEKIENNLFAFGDASPNFIFSSKQSGDEKEFAVAREGKLPSPPTEKEFLGKRETEFLETKFNIFDGGIAGTKKDVFETNCSKIKEIIEKPLDETSYIFEPQKKVHLPSPATENPFKFKHIVMSGGGAAGYSFLGAIQETFNQKRWDYSSLKTIYATSVGVIGAFSMAFKIEDFNDVVHYFIHRPWEKIFHMNGNLFQYFYNRGILGKDVIEEMFVPLLKYKKFDKNITLLELYNYSGIEVHCFTTELNSFSVVDISHKTHPNYKMIDTIYCSLCLPILFQPFFHDNKVYIDGGCLCNYPLYQCIKGQSPENEDEILGINIYDSPVFLKETDNLFDYLTHLISLLVYKARGIEEKKVFIKNEIIIRDYPDMHEIINVMGSVEKRTQLLQKGVNAVKQLPLLMENLPPPSQATEEPSNFSALRSDEKIKQVFNGFYVAREGEAPFAVASEDKFTFLAEASQEANRNFSKRSAENLYGSSVAREGKSSHRGNRSKRNEK